MVLRQLMQRIILFVFVSCFLLLTGCDEAPINEVGDIIASVTPAQVLIEKGPNIQRLNFDIHLSNGSEVDANINYIEFEVFDKADALTFRKSLSGNGLPGGLATLPKRDLEAGKSVSIFNPFENLPGRLDIQRLRVSIYFDVLETVVTEIFPKNYMPELLFALPVRQKAFINDGNDYYSHHRRVSLTHPVAIELGMTTLAQRFALDMTVMDENGQYREGARAPLTNWYAWGAQVYAPVAGEIVFARNAMADGIMQDEGGVIRPADYTSYGDDASAGNYVVIKASDSMFVMLAHFQKDSVQVSEGDQIQAGQLLGKIGLSGDTAYPHLHMQAQNGADILKSEPRPMRFNCVAFATTTGQETSNVRLDTGDLIMPCLD